MRPIPQESRLEGNLGRFWGILAGLGGGNCHVNRRTRRIQEGIML